MESDHRGTESHSITTCVDPENLDINKPLKFRDKETSLHWSEAPCYPYGARDRVSEPTAPRAAQVPPAAARHRR